MPHESQRIGDCPKCNGNDLACTYNRFERDGLTIDSWEHKCPDCGLRETTAHRSDEDEDDVKKETVDPYVCPYCGRKPQITI
jgi:ssDNA-binding Zn-finger/Zn-ribbon topoisomerase 1